MAEAKSYCLCGGGMTAAGTGVLVDALVDAFRAVHHGEGHGPATVEQARTRRRKADAAVLAEPAGTDAQVEPNADVHGEGNHRCRCGKLELQASEGCAWHVWRVERGAKLRPPMCSDCVDVGVTGYALSNLSLDPEHWSNKITLCSVDYLNGPRRPR